MKKNNYQFIGNQGEFILKNPHHYSYLYFPLCNDKGLKSSISPNLQGDMKLNQNTFLLEPVSSENLHETRGGRNFWVHVKGEGPWSLIGSSSKQKATMFTEDDEEVELKAGFLYQEITRISKERGLKSVVTSYVPQTEDLVELHRFELTNISNDIKIVTPTSAIPIYGRSADNIRDHRQVTSLLNRIYVTEEGVHVKPTLSFDERGHLINKTNYGVLGQACYSDGVETLPVGVFSTVEDFVGEGGDLEWPKSVVANLNHYHTTDHFEEGYEAMGALRFETVELKPMESVSFVIIMYINKEESQNIEIYQKELLAKYGSIQGFEKYLEANKLFWQKKLSVIDITSGEHAFDQWVKWVTIQPVLRRIYGCSFLPHHDYGRGGRGWRDLWQDCLALLMMEPEEVRFLLHNNFMGVRIDGSNATIIGSQAGEFIADRNNISRIWMDHGVWPWITTKEYIHQSGDMDFLFEKQAYFKDQQSFRSNEIDELWCEAHGNCLLTEAGNVYEGTILEHLLVQNVSIFFNVGKHNNLRLEGADWNDALDMASDLGESVAFTALYSSNLQEISHVLKEISVRKELTHIEVAKEMAILFDSISDINGERGIDYDSIEAKYILLDEYFEKVVHKISGETVSLKIMDVCSDLEKKANWMVEHLRENEIVTDNAGNSWFNSYYDNHGKQVEGIVNDEVRMMLTGQVFQIMGNVSTKEQTKSIVKACKTYLLDKSVGGYRLNTNFNELKSDLGRAFGFAYGHKENGAMFSHMAVMYSYALYKRGFVKDGFEVINDIYKHCTNFELSKIYPSVPEYINPRGRGMYSYLTGSASWLLFVVVSQMYGCHAHLGDLVIHPKLQNSQFTEGKASIEILFDKKPLKIEYVNAQQLSYGEYKVTKVIASVDGEEQEIIFNFMKDESGQGVVVQRQIVLDIVNSKRAVLRIILD